MQSAPEYTALFRAEDGGWLAFAQPREVHCAQSPGEVADVLAQVERALDAGRWAAGFLAYEAAPAFDAALCVHPPDGAPLAHFAVYDAPETLAALDAAGPAGACAWKPGIERDAYLRAIESIREYIAAGATYQVNYTFPIYAKFNGDARAWFARLSAAQGGGPHAFLDLGGLQILSVSPELFFRLDGDTLTTRPMKGTRPRGRFPREDRARAAELAASAKDCAENVMIVDLLRNDLGRVAETGTVSVPRLFDIERYETVWQMTSTITARTHAPLSRIFDALFPCGSVTGAPKIETMRIIRELEPGPRGAYCGAVGWCGPERQAVFNVAIRTVTVDKRRGTARYHAGGGITWDSVAAAEYQECLDKTAVLTHARPPFRLLESLLFDGDYFLLDEHLDRIEASADYFGFAFGRAELRRQLLEHAASIVARPAKVRLLLARDGVAEIESAPAPAAATVRLGLAREPVDSGNVFLFHKTTHRQVYEEALLARPDCGDVLLWNEDGMLTESTRANVVLDLDGKLLTPPVEAGLLAGSFRERLLRDGVIREAPLSRNDIPKARAIHLINSVRKWTQTQWVD